MCISNRNSCLPAKRPLFRQVGKHITALESVPPGVSARATQLFLSNNSLCSLRGLEPFSGVASLSVAHNLVRRTEDLQPLAALGRLETVSLEGNPVCGAANYRAHVISLCSPCLRLLDRREVLHDIAEHSSKYGAVGDECLFFRASSEWGIPKKRCFSCSCVATDKVTLSTGVS